MPDTIERVVQTRRTSVDEEIQTSSEVKRRERTSDTRSNHRMWGSFQWEWCRWRADGEEWNLNERSWVPSIGSTWLVYRDWSLTRSFRKVNRTESSWHVSLRSIRTPVFQDSLLAFLLTRIKNRTNSNTSTWNLPEHYRLSDTTRESKGDATWSAQAFDRGPTLLDRALEMVFGRISRIFGHRSVICNQLNGRASLVALVRTAHLWKRNRLDEVRIDFFDNGAYRLRVVRQPQ